MSEQLNSIRWCFLIIPLVFLIVACSLPGAAKGPARQTYVLQDKTEVRQVTPDASNSCLTLRINPPASSPGYLTAKMAYMQEPHQLDYFAYHEWVDTPARMLAAVMESQLDQTGLFAAVISGSSEIKADLRLDSEVLRMVQEFEVENSRVRFEVKVKLIDLGERMLLDSRRFDYIETAHSANAESGVAAANRAVERFMVDLSAFLIETIELESCPDFP